MITPAYPITASERVLPLMALDFTTAALDSRVTFTRASSATFTNSSGLIELAATDEPRFDYDPVTLAPKGLLIEEARTNLMTYSEDVSSGYSGLTNSTVTADATTAPDGAATADFVYATTTASADVRVSKTTDGTVTNTYSVYAKAGTVSFLYLTLRDSASAGNSVRAEFNLSTGAISIAAANAGTATGATAVITSVGNGWYRCSVAGIVGGTSVSVLSQLREISGNNTVTAGKGYYLWGSQLEVGSFPTSYIPTTSAAATRAVDVASMTGANFSSWFNATEGTLFAQASVAEVVLADRSIAHIARSTSASSDLFVNISRSADSKRICAVNDSANQYSYTPAGTVTSAKGALAYKLNDSQAAFDGTAGTTDTVCTIPSALTTLYIGRSDAANTLLNGHIQRISYFPTRLSEAQLAAITT